MRKYEKKKKTMKIQEIRFINVILFFRVFYTYFLLRRRRNCDSVGRIFFTFFTAQNSENNFLLTVLKSSVTI